MLKKSLLLMLLMTLLAPWVANAQATLPIGDGTSYATSGSSAGQTLGSPFGNTWYYNSTAQIIYTASELDGAKTINSLAFYHNANSFSATVKIYLAHTTSSTIDPDSPATDGTLVYTGTGISLGGSSAGWQTFTFDTNFEYNGTDNLLVVVCRTKYNSGYSQSQGWQYTATTNNMCMSRCSDTDAYGLITNTSYSYTATTNRPNVIIGYVPTTPYISLDPTSETVLVGLSKTITATYGNVSGTPTITYSSSNAKIASVSGSGTSATVTGNSVGTATITATMTYNATDYTATCAVTVEEPSYCKPSFSNTSDYIESFTTTGGEQNINNTNTGQGTGGYSNFYDTHFVSAEPETEIGFSVVRGYDDNYNYAIWVDWNKDYEFDNTTEKVAYTTSSTGDWTGSFTIPAATAAGDYHMRVIQVYSYAATPCVSASYGEGEDYKLTVIAASPYQKPVNLQVTNLTAATATITWEAPNSDVQSYKYQYREAGGTWSAPTSTTALSAPLTVLTATTTYEFQVQAIYAGNNESAFASTSFTTPCDAFSIDPTAYQYGFETADDMDCWELVNGVTNTAVWDNATIEYNFGYEPARTGDYCFMFFYVDYDDTDPEYQTLISPQLTDLPANGVHVEFYYVGDLGGSGQETFRVGYSTTDKNLSSFTWGTEITDASTAYQRFSANYPQGTKYVAVQHTSDDQYYLFLDDFTFEGAADCLEPSSVLADNITTTGASINWTAGGEEVAWDIYVTDDATIVPDDGTTPTYANISTKPYPLPGLTPATTYYVYVRAACKGTETSAWSTPAIFHTECEGMDLPYGPYGFEDGALSVCWNVINTNTSYNSVSVSASNANLGTHCLSFFRGSNTGDLVAVLPEVGAYDLSDYQFEFSAKGSYAGYEIYIGIMTDPDDLTTFVAQGDVITTTTSYAEHKVRFNGYTGTGKYVAIKVVRPSSVTYGSIYVDDIAINPIPNCIEPSGLAVSDETAHGATFGWTAGGSETEWHLYISDDPTAPADDIPVAKVTVADSNPFTITTGLDAETDYYVWVRANCGGTDGYSMWVGPETFTTGIACPAPTGLAYSEVTAHTAKLSWTGTSDSYNVWYRTAATMSNPIFSETFETSSLPTGWDRSSTALTDDVLNGTTTINSYSGGWVNTSYGLGQYNWKMNIYSTGKYWLITPSITLDAKNTLNFDAAITAYNSNNAPTSSNMANANSRFVVLITTDNQATWTILREWNNTGSADVLNNISNTGNNFSIDLTAYAGETVKIAFYGGQTASGPDCDLHIDNVVIGTPVEAGEWTKKTADASPYVATGLLAETKYEAQVQGNCGSEGTSQWTSSVFFTTDIACPAPTALAASNPTSTSFDLQWNNGGSEDWVLAYKVDGAADFTELDLNVSDVTEEAGTISYTLGGLDAETDYIVKVRDNCEASIAGDGYSAWTDEVAYSTVPSCSALNPVVSDITHHNATVNFEGESATGFNVYYRTAAGINASFSETFDAATLPTGWDKSDTPLTDDVLAGTTTIATGYQYGWISTSYGLGQYNWKMNIYNTNKFWLITPSVTIGTNNILNFDAAITKYNDNIAPTTTNMADANSRFVVLITTDDMATWTILREWNNTGSADVLNNISNTGNNFTIDLSSYKDETVKIAFYGHQGSSGPDCDLHIDNVMVGEATTPGAWETEAATSTAANLTGLTAGTKYDVKVVPNCDNTIESNTVQFTTLSDNVKYFLTAGDWNDADNWMDSEIPTIDDDAVIRANANIFGDAAANKITFSGSPTPVLTIENGGTLQTNTNVTATVKKHIKGYGEAHASEAIGYYLIANPLNSTVYSYNFATVGLTSGNYDLYAWSYMASDGNEWRNYKASTFSLSTVTGYLYANEADDLYLTFTGTVAANNNDVNKPLNYASSGSYAFNGWNLVGNPFVCNAYTKDATSTDIAFYRMNNAGSGFEAATGAIKPMEGIFVKATATSQSFNFTREQPITGYGNGNLNISLANVVTSRDAVATTDKAIVRFDGGGTLEKFMFREDNMKIYIPQDGTDFAVVASEAKGMLPVNVKVTTTGEYTISISNEDVDLTYLHLIDRLTGEDVDLLIEDSYTFYASPRDQENRFTLVFNSIDGNIDATSEIFAYQNGDEIIVSGEGTLQVYDVMGRFVASYNVNGTESINASQFENAVYIFRLVGTDVKTQKIVVR